MGDAGSTCCVLSRVSLGAIRSKDGALERVGVSDMTGVAGMDGAGVTGNFSRVGSINVKYMLIPFARLAIRLARS